LTLSSENITTPPFAHGVAGAAKLAGRGFDAVLAGEGDELLVEGMTVGAHAVEFKKGVVHGGRMAKLSHRGSGPSGGA